MATPGIAKMRLEFKNLSPNPDPIYRKEGDSGFDLRVWTDTDIILHPGQRALIHTGLYFSIPDDCELQIRPRSGCATKLGLTVINTPGTADSNYTGELMIGAINLDKYEPITIKNGERIAQGVLCPVFNSYFVDLIKVDEIDKETERGADGFMSTGIE